MIKSEIVSNFVNRIPQDGVMMYEIFADMSLHLDEYDREELKKFDSYYWCFSIIENGEGKRTLYLFSRGKKEDDERMFYKMIENENKRRRESGRKIIGYDPNRIVFVNRF